MPQPTGAVRSIQAEDVPGQESSGEEDGHDETLGSGLWTCPGGAKEKKQMRDIERVPLDQRSDVLDPVEEEAKAPGDRIPKEIAQHMVTTEAFPEGATSEQLIKTLWSNAWKKGKYRENVMKMIKEQLGKEGRGPMPPDGKSKEEKWASAIFREKY